MDHPEITFNEDGNIVSIWVGSFGTQAAVDVYVAEQYDEDRENESLSEFAGDIGLKHYDHDFIEVRFQPELSRDGPTVFARHSYGESFAPTAWGTVERMRIGPFDTVLLLYGYEHVGYPQAAKQPRRVRFVGTFPYVREESEWLRGLLRGE
jgi:hypothetical protein